MMTIYSSVTCIFVWISYLVYVAQSNFVFGAVNSSCVWTENQLRKVIAKASNETRTRITICRPTILVSKKLDYYGRSGIDVSDRFIDIRCKFKPSVGGCILDGQGSSRIFFGERTDLTVKNVNFINAKPDDCISGGAVNFDRSIVRFTGCSFTNNGRTDLSCPFFLPWGGAIRVIDSTVTINGGSEIKPVIFSDNVAERGGAIYINSCNISFGNHTVFSHNSATERAGAVYLFESTVNMQNVRMQYNFCNSGAALYSLYSQTTMEHVMLTENLGDDSETEAAYFSDSSLQATDCTFSNHNITVLRVSQSKITLENSTFSKNKLEKGKVGSNIFIYEDENPLYGGSFVKCKPKTVFCNGLGNSSIFVSHQSDSFYNTTDCKTKGVKGTPGKGTCPI